MSELILMSSFVLLLLSFFAIKKIFSEYVLGIAVALSLYPVIKDIDSTLAAALIVAFIIFELITLNNYYHYKKKFNTKTSFKTALSWLAICLTVGTSLVFWAHQREIGLMATPFEVPAHWWKIALVLALIICSGVKTRKIKGSRHG